MGYEYGSMLDKNGFKLPALSEKELDLGLKSREHVKRFFPEILAEIRGVADGCNLDYDALSAFLLSLGGENRCSIFGVNDGKNIFVGRNYDYYYWYKNYLESHLTMPEGCYWSLGHTDIFVGRDDGVNEKGLVVAMAGIVGHMQPGINFQIAIRYILDKCSTVKEGVTFLKEIPHFSTMTFLLVDASGDLVVVEASPKKTAVRMPGEKGFVISTNHLNYPDMLDIPLYEPPDSRIRYNMIERMLKSGNELNEQFIESILRDHSGLVCSHREDIQLGTLWSVVYDIKRMRIFRAEGHPCKNEYKLDTRLEEALRQRKTS